MSSDNALIVLDYERASEVIKTASHRGVGLCYCRHKMEHVGRACDAPLDICMTFNATAASLVRHGFARAVDVAEGLALVDQAYGRNLVQLGENIRCVRVCKTKSLRLKTRPERVITPLNSVHKAVLMAIERGKLQNLIFDNNALASHRAMAAVLGVILRLPL